MKKISLLAIAVFALVFNVNAQSYQGFNADGMEGVSIEEAYEGIYAVLKLVVPSEAVDVWNAQLVTPRFEGLEGQVEGASFEFSFDYKGAVDDGSIRIASGKTYPFDSNWNQGANSQIVDDEGSIAVYGLDQQVSTEWQNFSYRYFIGPDGADSIRLEIDCGRAVGAVFFKNFVLKIGGKVVAEYYKVNEYETIEINGITYLLYKDGTAIVGYANNSLSGDVAIADYIAKDGKKYPVSAISSGAFSYCSGMTSVNIPNTVRSIGSQAFFGCSGLNSVIIPNSVDSIGFEAFAWCTGLESVTIPESVSKIAENAFVCCDKIEALTYNTNAIGEIFSFKHELSSVNIGSSVTRIGENAFRGCDKLMSIVIPNSVTAIEDYAFSDCYNLNSVVIPETVDSIGRSAFSFCTGLPTIEVPNSVKYIEYDAFYQVKNIQYAGEMVDYDNWGALSINGIVDGDFLFADTAKSQLAKYVGQGGKVVIPNSVTCIGEGAFRECYTLSSVVFPNTLKSVSSTAFAFSGLSGSIILPNTLESIGDSAFMYCSDLDTVVIPNSVTSIGKCVFWGCFELKYAKCPDSMTCIMTSMFDNCQSLSSVVFPNTIKSVSPSAFNRCSSLSGDFIIPNSVETIGESAFYGCSGLTSVSMPESLKFIGQCAFEYCTGLLSISVPSSVDSIGFNAFCGIPCVYYYGNATYDEYNYAWGARFLNPVMDENFVYSDSTKSEILAYIGKGGDVVIPNTVSVIAERAFEYCGNITSVKIPNSVVEIGAYAFCYCDGLKSVIIPNSINAIRPGTFGSCYLLDSIFIPNSVTSIGANAFLGCYGLKHIDIPESVSFIGSFAFSGCSGMSSVVLPNSVTKIDEYVFEGCTGLSSIFIPNSVTSIESYAFLGCYGLKHIDIPESVSFIGSCAFQGCDNLTINCDFVSQPQGWSADWNPDSRPVIWKTDAMADESLSQVAIYSYSNVIVVENANADILVYDAMGRLVARRSEATCVSIAMSNKGIYIVKVGNEIKRVAVE